MNDGKNPVPDKVDTMLREAGWFVQDKESLDLKAGPGIAIREFQTDSRPVDYILFIDRKAAGLIEIKPEQETHHLTVQERQVKYYTVQPMQYFAKQPLFFQYTCTGIVTLFTDTRDPAPLSREIFHIHTPGTIKEWLRKAQSLRGSLKQLPQKPLEEPAEFQWEIVHNLEELLKTHITRIQIRMAAYSSLTLTTFTVMHRLLKYTNTKRILFLVDTHQQACQAKEEFSNHTPVHEHRKFAKLHDVQFLISGSVSGKSRVYISTIRSVYALLKGEELNHQFPGIDYDAQPEPAEPVTVTYNSKLPVETFDFIVLAGCRPSHYTIWKPVLEYFDAFIIGFTAIPGSAAFGFYNQTINGA